jgi:hypothetical protein
LTPGLTAADSAVEHGKNRDLTYTVRGGTPAQDINEGHQLTDFTDSLLELYWDQTAENFRPEVTEANRAADLRAHYLGNTAASAILVHQAA